MVSYDPLTDFATHPGGSTMSYTPPPSGWSPGPGGFGTPPSGYGTGAGYQSQGRPIEHPQGVTILVLGIIGTVFCQLTAPIAWSMGNAALREIDANPGRYSNRSTVQAGRVCGIVGTVLIGVEVLAAFVLIIVAGVSAGS